MSRKPSIAALVPMRHDSKRVPGKNYRPFGGRPLYHHVVSNLLACPLVTHVAIDTDSEVIFSDAAKHFPTVELLRRPEHLRADTMPMNDVLLHTTSHVKADFYLQTHSTNPLLRPDTITRAVESLVDQYPAYDSLFTVTRVQNRLWDQLGRAINHNPAILLRTQDLPPVYEENSCLYLFTRQTLESCHNRVGQRPLLFELPRLEATDIDEEHDFHIAELLYLGQRNTARAA